MFNVVNDNFAESPESFTVTVTLTQAVASSPVSSASGTVTITDVDGKKTHVHADSHANIFPAFIYALLYFEWVDQRN